MGQSIEYDGNATPLLSNDMVSQQGFVHTQNENALENHFIYFSYLNDDEAQTAYKRANLKVKEFSKCPPPLGLKLTITPALLQSVEEKLNGAAETITSCQTLAKKDGKLKAGHFRIQLLRIGLFMTEAKYAADHLMAKCYYAKRTLVWEILRNGLKEKIEIQWDNILALRAVIEENMPGILEIELDRVPSFFRETAPKRGKHTIWVRSEDFTARQASKYRRHYLQFPSGVLDQNYVNLLQYDNRLMELSQKPFPSLHSPYFDSHVDQGIIRFHFGYDQHVHGSKTTSTSDEQQPILELPVGSTQQVQEFGNAMPLPLIAINDPTSDFCSPTNEAINNQKIQDQQASRNQRLNYYEALLSMESVPCASYLQRNEPAGSNYELPSHISDMLLAGYYIPEIVFDERHMGNIVQSINAIADLSMEEGPAYNTNTSTQIDWPNTSGNSWNAPSNGSGEQYYAINANLNPMDGDPSVDQHHNANLNPMHGDPFVDQHCLFYPEELITSPSQVCNEGWFVDTCARHIVPPLTTPK